MRARRERRIRERAALRRLQKTTAGSRVRTAQAWRSAIRITALPPSGRPNRAAVRRKPYGPNGGPRS